MMRSRRTTEDDASLKLGDEPTIESSKKSELKKDEKEINNTA